jgi:hypothetical protein
LPNLQRSLEALEYINMDYQETHTEETYKQDLNIGDITSFQQHAQVYKLEEGWLQEIKECRVCGFEYPFILISNGGCNPFGVHYSRIVQNVKK